MAQRPGGNLKNEENLDILSEEDYDRMETKMAMINDAYNNEEGEEVKRMKELVIEDLSNELL